MSYIKHTAIIVTSWDSEAMREAATTAESCGLQALGPSTKVVNGFRTLLICPDGSKAGWPEAEEAQIKRESFLRWLNAQRYEDGSSRFEWVEIAYGNDDRAAQIVSTTWTGPEEV